jgi:hypothetical protein
VAARIAGSGSNVTLTLVNTRNPATKQDFRGAGVMLTGSSNIVRLAAQRVPDDALVVSGDYNLVEVATDGAVRDVGRGNSMQGNKFVQHPPVDRAGSVQPPASP